jgi:adenine-specific DNA-methyltransferase
MFVNKLDFARLIAQLDGVVPVDAGGGASKISRRARGQVFTPAWLADLVCELTLGRSPGPVTVLDPAAGDGAMLAAVARRAPDARLIGWERDAGLVRRCRAQLPTANVHQLESLFGAPAAPGFDAVIANPPYIRSIRLRAIDPDLWSAVRGTFVATSRGEWDLYGAFIERSLTWVRPGGRVGLIVPSRWLTAQWAQPLRALGQERA